MGGSGDITPFEFPIFRSSPEECSTLLAVPLCFATIRHVVTDRGLRSVADRKCAGAVARSVLRCRPSGFPAVHHIREALAPLVQNLILYAYPGPGLRLAEQAAFHSSTGCRPGTYLFVTCCGTAYRIASHGQQVGLFRVRRVSYSRQALLLRRSWRPSRSGRQVLLVARGCYHPREVSGFRLTASDPETRPCMTRRMRNDAQSRNWEST